jgi:uncharacterized repeat protein (TIGR01451 family)
MIRGLLLLLVSLTALMAAPARAQTATAEWSSLGVAANTAATNPGTITASDGTSVAISYSAAINGAGTAAPSIGNSYVTYYTTSVGGAAPSLLLNMDNTSYDNLDKITLNVTLGRSVSNLAFTIADIDRDNTTNRDSVEVSYDTGDGIFRNAADISVWAVASSVDRRNDTVVNGWRGTGTSANTATTGNVAFNFGTTTVKRIRIVYFSYTGSGNPAAQSIALSKLQFAAPNADLSLSKSMITNNPVNGGSATFRLTVTSAAASSTTASGVQVRDILPTGFTFVSATGTGSYVPATGVWSAGSLAPGASASIDLIGTVNASSGVTLSNNAEIIASSAADSDSTPANGATGEDDYDSATLTISGSRTAGSAPTLVCAAGSALFDWTGKNWTAGSTDNTYPLAALGNIRFQMVNPGAWLNDTAFGGQSPNLQTIMHGGTSDRSLIGLINLPNRSSEMTTTITLPAAMSGAQFKLFDVDFGTDQFADRVQIVGRRNGVDVIPHLTNGVANYVIGNTAYGDAVSENNSSNGNVTVTFTSAIDSIVIRYGNHSLAPNDPGQQAITLHDMTLCNPTFANIDVTKISQVLSDPVSGTTNPKAVPGAIMQYCITIGNSGNIAASNIAAVDNLPAHLSYVAGSMLSGAACNNAVTVEDDNAAGADETPVGASHSASTISINATTIAASGGFAVVFRAQVN